MDKATADPWRRTYEWFHFTVASVGKRDVSRRSQQYLATPLEVQYLHTARLFPDLEQILRRKVGVHNKESRLGHPARLLQRVSKDEVNANFRLASIKLGHLTIILCVHDEIISFRTFVPWCLQLTPREVTTLRFFVLKTR